MTNRKQAAIVLFSAVFITPALCGPSVAGPLADAAIRAEQMAASGDTLGARSTIETAIGNFSASLPLTIARAVFVSGEPTGFSMYTPRPAAPFKLGEQLVSYVEPVGLTWKPSAEPGKQAAHFTVDFDILDRDGVVLASQKTFGDFTFTGFTRNQEIYSMITIDLTSAPVGGYVLRLHVNDVNSGKKASVDQPFSLIAADVP